MGDGRFPGWGTENCQFQGAEIDLKKTATQAMGGGLRVHGRNAKRALAAKAVSNRDSAYFRRRRYGRRKPLSHMDPWKG